VYNIINEDARNVSLGKKEDGKRPKGLIKEEVEKAKGIALPFDSFYLVDYQKGNGKAKNFL